MKKYCKRKKTGLCARFLFEKPLDIETIAFFEKCRRPFLCTRPLMKNPREIPGSKNQGPKKRRSLFTTNTVCLCVTPYCKVKGRPEVYLIITFGLPCRLDSPRIAEAVEPYPSRWTHHVIVEKPADIDRQLLGWIDMAYEFAWNKQRRCQL